MRVCLHLCPTCGCIFTPGGLSFSLHHQCVNIINKLTTSLSASPINLRADTGGALFSSGRLGTAGEAVTTAPVTATATVSTRSLSAAALDRVASLITWSSALPRWQRLTLGRRQRTW